jgi:hypothetical protein
MLQSQALFQSELFWQSGRLQHVRHIRGVCGIGKDHVSQVCGSQAGSYCHSKKIDGFRSLVTKQMRPKDAIRPILDYFL